jgi:hypothetical protein
VSNQWISVRFVSATGPQHAKAVRRARRAAGDVGCHRAGPGHRRRARGLHAYGDGRRQSGTVLVTSRSQCVLRAGALEPVDAAPAARPSRAAARRRRRRNRAHRGRGTASLSSPPATGGVGGPSGWVDLGPTARAGCRADNPRSYSERSGKRYPRSALTTSPLLLSFVSSVLTVPVAMPVAFAISGQSSARP